MMVLFVALALRGLGLVACGALIIVAINLAMPRPLEFRPWPICLGIAILAALGIAAIAALMLMVPQ